MFRLSCYLKLLLFLDFSRSVGFIHVFGILSSRHTLHALPLILQCGCIYLVPGTPVHNQVLFWTFKEFTPGDQFKDPEIQPWKICLSFCSGGWPCFLLPPQANCFILGRAPAQAIFSPLLCVGQKAPFQPLVSSSEFGSFPSVYPEHTQPLLLFRS